MKKHIALLLSMSLIAMLLPAAALGEAGGEADIEALLSGMTLEQKVGQMMIVAFRIWKEVPETDDGQEVPLRPGTVHYCRPGHSHSIVNTGREPLVLFAVIPTTDQV